MRRAKAIRQLEDAHGYTNLVNLRGGILGWQEHIDPSLARCWAEFGTVYEMKREASREGFGLTTLQVEASGAPIWEPRFVVSEGLEAQSPSNTSVGVFPPKSMRSGFSIISFTMYKKPTLSLPSTMRWS